MINDQILRTIADEIPAGVWVVRIPSGSLIYVNPTFEQMSGCRWGTSESAQSLWTRCGMHARTGEPCVLEQSPFEQALGARARVSREDLVLHREDGGKTAVRVSASPVLDKSGNLGHLLVSFWELGSELKMAGSPGETQRFDEIGRVAGGIAHDFNNLLSMLSAATALLRMGEQSPRRLEALEHIDSVVLSASHLTRSLMELRRRPSIPPKPTPLNEVAEHVWTLVARTLGASIHGRLELNAGSDCVVAESAPLEQLVLNLLVNAREAMPDGGLLTLRTRAWHVRRTWPGQRPDGADGVVLEVSDTGNGIPPGLRDRIFEAGFTTKAAGHGMGLATVVRIVDGLGGRIEVLDNRPAGTTMRVMLPLVREASAHRECVPPPLS